MLPPCLEFYGSIGAAHQLGSPNCLLSAEAFTPWFKLIVKQFLFPWWSTLAEASSGSDEFDALALAFLKDDKIHRLL